MKKLYVSPDLEKNSFMAEDRLMNSLPTVSENGYGFEDRRFED